MLQFVTMPLGAYQTNCYILRADTSDRCVVIDPGYEPETILSKLRSLGKSLEAILLTHCHFDHVGAVKELAMATDCKKRYATADAMIADLEAFRKDPSLSFDYPCLKFISI